MTKVIIRPASANPRIMIKSVGTQGVAGAHFRVVDDVFDLTPDFGNDKDTAITVLDGAEYRKTAGVWLATGRTFWGTLLIDTTALSEQAEQSASTAEGWATATGETASAAILAINELADGALSAIDQAKTDDLNAISTITTQALNTITETTDTAFSLITETKTNALLALNANTEAALTSVTNATGASQEFARLAGVAADATAADVLLTKEDARQTAEDKIQTGNDFIATARDRMAVEAALEIIRTEYVVYVAQAVGVAVPVGQYLATASGLSTGIFDRMILKVPSGNGSVFVQLVVNGSPRSAVYEVTNAAPVILTGLSIAINQGDTVSFAVLGGTASQLWAQITGLLK